jgi:hypothetical protein
MKPLSVLKRNLAARFAKSADRREHDLALRDPRAAVEHQHASQHATARGESGCAYCG